MRVHDDVAQARVLGQRHRDGWRLALRVPALFQDLTHGGYVRRLGLKGASQGIIDSACTVEIEERGQPGGRRAQITVARGQGSKEGGSVRTGMMLSLIHISEPTRPY